MITCSRGLNDQNVEVVSQDSKADPGWDGCVKRLSSSIEESQEFTSVFPDSLRVAHYEHYIAPELLWRVSPSLQRTVLGDRSMKLAARSMALLSSMSLILAIGAVKLTAQEPKPQLALSNAGINTSASKKGDPARRVPPYFGQIGLRPTQRDDIYKIRAKHLVKITDLEAKIETTRAEMLTECESVLDEIQKQVLVSRRKSPLSLDPVPSSNK